MDHPFLRSWTQDAARLTGAHLPWLTRARTQAWEDFSRSGLPTQRDEPWRNTDLSALRALPLHLGSPWTPDLSLLPDLPGSHRLVFAGGALVPRATRVLPEPTPWLRGSLGSLLMARPQDLEPLLAEDAGPGMGAFDALNTAFFQDGAVLSVPEGATVEHPVHLVVIHGTPGTPTHQSLRHQVHLGAGARLTLVEHHLTLPGADSVPCLTNTTTRVHLGDASGLEHVHLQAIAPSHFHVASVRVRQGRISTYSSHSMALGGALARTEAHVFLEGADAQASLHGLSMGRGRQVLDHLTFVEHGASGGRSRQSFRALLDGASRGVFNGKVLVRRGATRTDAYQSSRSLLLSREAWAHARPQLEIYDDDVKCSHGATTGRLDEEALFYLRARGIGRDEARRLLARAFALEVLPRPEALRGLVEGPVESWLQGLGEAP